ncbi:MAG: two-component sensor histidine kinase [Pseudomonadota bacterium]|jgi:two-component system sensor histidine kinase RegB
MWLAWVIRLRWVAIGTQALTLSLTFAVIDSPLHVIPLLALAVVALLVVNAMTLRRLRSGEPVGREQLLLQLLLDIGELTLFFLCSGGATNPFVMLYLVHVAMAAVMLDGPAAGVVVAVVAIANLALHVGGLPLHLERHVLAADTLLRFGQVTAFTVTAVSIGAFVIGMSATLRRNKQRLMEARERSHRNDRLRAIGTLAAGAAHELNTPLSTVGLRLRRIERRHHDAETRRDLDVASAQVARCAAIVDNLLVGAGDPTARGMEQVDLNALVGQTVRMWEKSSAVPATFTPHAHPVTLDLPPIAFMQALINLLENAREAQTETHDTTAIDVRIERDGERGIVRVVDHGPGMADHADRVGDPFFTTKATGTGLGVFVARAVAEGAGGGLRYDRDQDATHAVWWFVAPEKSP